PDQRPARDELARRARTAGSRPFQGLLMAESGPVSRSRPSMQCVEASPREHAKSCGAGGEKRSDIGFKRISPTYHPVEASRVWLCARAQRSLCAFIMDFL